MAQSRSWRLIGLEPYGGEAVELAEVALFDGITRVDGDAVFSTSLPPTYGARFSLSTVLKNGFALLWQFPTERTVDRAELTLSVGSAKTSAFILQALNGSGLWESVYRWRGAFSGSPLTQEPPVDPYYANVLALIDARYQPLACLSPIPPDFTTTTWGAVYYGGTDSNGIPYIRNATGPDYNPRAATKFISGVLDGDFSVEARISTDGVTSGRSTVCGFGESGWRLRFGDFNFSNYALSLHDASGNMVIAPVYGAFGSLISVKWIREAGVHRLVIQGTVVATYTDGSPIVFDRIVVGRETTGTTPFRMSTFRVTKDVVRPNSAEVWFDYFKLPTPSGSSDALDSFAGYYVPPINAVQLTAPAHHHDTWDGGTVSIVGNVKKVGLPTNQPLRRKVRLYHLKERRFLRETWSDAVTGDFVFPGLKSEVEYYVMVLDHEHVYRALVADRIVGA